MFDLGGTLIGEDERPFAHVEDALTTISQFTTPNGDPLRRCLVSDFTMPVPPPTAAKIAALFKEYLAILDRTGLRRFFEPVQRRVTLSTHAGVAKPARKFFQKALQRLRVAVPLTRCLFVTENAQHIRAAREKLEMATLQFRSQESAVYDFDDWADAPMLIANLVGPKQFANVEAAVKSHLAATRGVTVQSVRPSVTPGAIHVTAQVWKPITVPDDDELRGVCVPFSVEGEVHRGDRGEVTSVALGEPSAEELEEAASYVRSLAVHGQIGGHTRTRGARATHRIETDAQGNRRLVRTRFSAA